MTWRRLGALVENLPRDSALWRSIHGEEEALWGLHEQLLALLADLMAHSNWLFAAANSKNPPPKPKPIQRPGVGRDDKARDAILARARKFKERQEQKT